MWRSRSDRQEGADNEPDDALQVLQARARSLAEPVAPEADEGVDLLVFSAGPLRLAAPCARVRELLPPGPTASVPGGGHALVGLRAVRGEVVVLADVASLLGEDREAPHASERVAVVLDDPTAPLGVLADRIDCVAARTGPARDTPTDPLVEEITGEGLLVLDIDSVLADPRLSIQPTP